MNRVATLSVAAVALLVAAGIVTTAASILATSDDGSAFARSDGFVAAGRAAGADVVRVTSTPNAALGHYDPRHAVLAVLEAPRGYEAQEAERIDSFLLDGGTVLLADPFGDLDAVAARWGATFERVRLVLPDDVRSTAQIDGVEYPVRWLQPSAVRIKPGTDATVIAASPDQSFLDRDGNGTIDLAEPHGAFPIAASLPVGKGRLVLVADRALLEAPSAEDESNAAFRSGLLAHLLPEGGTLLVDESRGGSQAPVLQGLAALHDAAALAPWRGLLVASGAVLLLLPLLPDLRRAWSRHEYERPVFMRRADLASALAEPAPVSGSHWTRRGAAALSSCGALLLLGLVLGRVEAIAAAALLLAAVGVSVGGGVPRVDAVRVTSTTRADEQTPVEVRLRMAGLGRGMRTVQFLDQLPSSFRLLAGSNHAQRVVRGANVVEFTYTCTPTLRGPHRIGPLLAQTSDPFGLRVRRVVVAPAVEVEVAPRQESVRRIPFATKVPTVTLGPHLVNRAGDGSEFHALRDYVQGDSLRSVNWKASARAGGLMVNQRVHESMTRLTILLDARAVSAAGPADASPLADGCRSAVSIAAAALRVRDRVRIAVYGDGVLEVPDAPGSRQLHQLREVLSRLEPRGSTSLVEAVEALAPTLRERTPLLVLSGLEGDEGFVAGIRAVRNRGLLPLVLASPVHVAPPDGPEEPGSRDILDRREKAIAQVQAMGIPIFESKPGVPLDHVFTMGGVA